MNRFKYKIYNLDCANCARKIEDALNKNEKLNNVKVNFNTMMISYYANENISVDEINKMIKKIEPNSYISSGDSNDKKEYHFSILIIAVIISLIGNFIKIPILSTILLIISYILLLYKVFINTCKLLINGEINENALILISCIGAFILGNAMEGMMVIVLYTIGKILEEKALNFSRKSIKDLMDIKSEFAYVKKDNDIKKVLVEEVKIGDILVVKKGEKIAVDGIITKGETFIDEASLTGESEKVYKTKNDAILSGSINLGEVIEFKATNVFANSTVSKILELLESATDKKAKTETMVSKISKIYTPVILILSLLVGIFLPLISDVTYSQSIYRALTFLVISCPCAIAISIPLSYFSGIGTGSKKGILVKGSNYLDNLSNAKMIVFDKTGTLTTGNFEVTNINIYDKNYNKKDVINYLALGESFSNHPIAKSILKLSKGKINTSGVKNYKESIGKGISYEYKNDKVVIGNSKVCNCKMDGEIHLNINGKHIAAIDINDEVKSSSSKVIKCLKSFGIKTYMFTGDKKKNAIKISEKLGIDETKYEMLPQDKYKEFEKLKETGNTVIFVGDGVNDAPTLKRADIGISMGGVASQAAIEASDIVLMNDDLNKIILAIEISKYTKFIIKENLIFAMSIKIIILLLSLFGLANMWLAVFADTGVTLITILNSLRILRKFSK